MIGGAAFHFAFCYIGNFEVLMIVPGDGAVYPVVQGFVDANIGKLVGTDMLHGNIRMIRQGDICLNHVIPAAVKYQNVLIENVRGMKDIFGEDFKQLCSSEMETLKKIATYINRISADVDALVEARKKANRVEDIAERAKIYSREVKDMMDKVRDSADNLEMLIDDELWPLPKYRELLFFRQ